MTTIHGLAITTLGAVSAFTGVVLVFVVRAQRLNHADCCGWCGNLLGLESRFRFHGRTVCERCSRRLRFVTIPRSGRITVLLTLWGAGLAALAILIEEHDPDVVVWATVFGGLVAAALIAGAMPPITRSADRTAATLRQLHAWRQAERRREEAEVD